MLHRQRWKVSVRSEEGGPPREVGVRPENLRVLVRQPEGVPSAADWLATNRVEGLEFYPELPPMIISADLRHAISKDEYEAMKAQQQRQGAIDVIKFELKRRKSQDVSAEDQAYMRGL